MIVINNMLLLVCMVQFAIFKAALRQSIRNNWAQLFSDSVFDRIDSVRANNNYKHAYACLCIRIGTTNLKHTELVDIFAHDDDWAQLAGSGAHTAPHFTTQSVSICILFVDGYKWLQNAIAPSPSPPSIKHFFCVCARGEVAFRVGPHFADGLICS